MRLRLRICRHELPPTKVLLGVPDSPTSVSKLLELINDLVPLESADWGLEDYVVEHDSYECLHYSEVHQVLKDDDQLTIRPLQKPDILSRRLSGRYQVAANGARLVDGIPFGRQYLKRPSRPDIHIPPLKRRRIGDAQEDDIYDEDTSASYGNGQLALPSTLLSHDESSEQAESPDNSTASLKNASNSSQAKGGLRSGKARRNVSFQTDSTTIGVAAEASNGEEEDDSDESEFRPGGNNSNPESSSEDSEDNDESGSDHASAGKSNDTKSPAGSSDDTSSSSSEAGEESSSQSSSSDSSANSNEEANETKSTNEPIETKLKASEQGSAKPKDRPKSSTLSQTPPGHGKRETRIRNRRRKLRMKRSKCLHFGQMVLWLASGYRDPDSPDNKNVQDVEKRAPLWRCVREKLEQFPEFETLLRAIAEVGTHHDEFGKFEQYHDRIQQFANKGQFERVQRLLPPPLNNNFADDFESDKDDVSQLSNRKANLLDQIGKSDDETGHELESNVAAKASAGDQVRERSIVKFSRPPPKKKPKKDDHGQDLEEVSASDANVLFDPNEWKDKLAVGVVECRDEELSLPPPPFPFVKWWWNGGENPNNPSKKRYGNKRGPKRKNTRHVDQSVGVDAERDGLQYDEIPDDNQQKDFSTGKENGNVNGDINPSQENVQSDHDEIPDLPGDLSELEDLELEKCHAAMTIVFRRLEVSQSTNWQPAMSPPRTATITSIDSEAKVLFMRLAKRDRERPNFELDEDGNQLYDKFGTLEDDCENGDIEVLFSELVDPKVLQTQTNGT
ncbi:MAG: hypothetical protein M1831_001754 [Alyxoria varia]|nr:MAG: hypothetical protein M1831_001754 [Alyxoria varia]